MQTFVHSQTTRVTFPLQSMNALRRSTRRRTGLHCKPASDIGYELGSVDGPLEQEADYVAESVVQEMYPSVSKDNTSLTTIEHDSNTSRLRKRSRGRSRAGSVLCSESCTICDPGFSAKSIPETFSHPFFAVPQQQGQLLPDDKASLMGELIGDDFRDVRIHTGPSASKLSNDLNAEAFTIGRDIWFGGNRYDPESKEGTALLAHELTHAAQSGNRTVSPKNIYSKAIQRKCTHDGTPTNAHNWAIPLPPWLAGTFAHTQIELFFAQKAMAYPHAIPRATKISMGKVNPPFGTPYGFADLWQNTPANINIGEIKSTATGSGIASLQAAHYVLRHMEWLARIPHKDFDDTAYLLEVGLTKPALLSNFSPLTGPDLNLGPFVADPLKDLHIEADNAGAVVYWCVGSGMPFNPLWYPAFKKAYDKLRDALDQARRVLEAAIEAIVAAASYVTEKITGWVRDLVTWGRDNAVTAFLLLLAIVIIALLLAIIFGILEIPTAGADTPATLASLAAAFTAAAGLLFLIGIDVPMFKEKGTVLANSLAAQGGASQTMPQASGSEYDSAPEGMRAGASPVGSSSPAAATDPGRDFIATLEPVVEQLSKPQQLLRRAQNADPAAISAGIERGTAVLARMGRKKDVEFILNMRTLIG